MHQLAAHRAVRPRLVAGVPRRRADRHRSPHARVLVRARGRPRAAGDEGARHRLPGSRSTTTTRSGTPSTTTTGRRSTSSTLTASSGTTTSAKAATRSRSASSSGCSASSASSSHVEGVGVEAEADWDSLRTPETYLGYARSEHFASPGRRRVRRPRRLRAPDRLPLNHWALAGEWTIGREKVVLDEAGGSIAYRFHARDVHLVLAPGGAGRSRSGCSSTAQPPGSSHGVDVDEDGQRAAPGWPAVPACPPARHGPRAHDGDHVPRARRRGLRVHVRIAGDATAGCCVLPCCRLWRMT